MIDHSKYFTKASSSRKPSAIRDLQKYTAIKGIISFGGGLPNPSLFPLESITLNLKGGEKITLTETETKQMLQYGGSKGFGPLLEFLRNLQLKIHSPSVAFDCLIGSGSQDLITRTMESLLECGDCILIEEPTYVGILAFLKPMGVKVIGVETDEFGIIPESLNSCIKNAEVKPKCVYIVPVSGNPTGVSTSIERKKQIYEICSSNDILILEDDPYFYLQYELPYVPSFLSIDTRGLVIRFDSFSKIISGGSRVGFITAAEYVIQRLELQKQCTDLHTSIPSQMIVYKLCQHWGIDGFIEHTRKVASFYDGRCLVFCSLLDKYLKGKVTYSRPTSGMFIWLKLIGIEDSNELITTKAREALILILPGKEFYYDNRTSGHCRLSFSIASDEEMELGISRLATLLN